MRSIDGVAKLPVSVSGQEFVTLNGVVCVCGVFYHFFTLLDELQSRQTWWSLSGMEKLYSDIYDTQTVFMNNVKIHRTLHAYHMIVMELYHWPLQNNVMLLSWKKHVRHMFCAFPCLTQ